MVPSAKLTDQQIAAILERIDGVTLSEIASPVFGGFGSLRHAQYQVQSFAPSKLERKIKLSEADRVQVARAFERVRQGYEPDRVLVDPKLSREFIAECRRRGLGFPVTVLNRAIQNIRKAKLYGIDFRDSKKGSNLNPHPFLSVAELGYAQLNQLRTATVDQILTNPRIGDEFVAICRSIDPRGSAMIYKWAALSLRKSRALGKERLERIASVDVAAVESRLRIVGDIESLQIDRLPDDRGVYAFSETLGDAPYLYIGASENLSMSMKPFVGGRAFRTLSEEALRPPRIENIKLMFAKADTKRYLLAKTTPLMASLGLISARHPVYNMSTADAA